MPKRTRPILLALPLLIGACVRWGVPDVENDDWSYDDTTTFDEDTTSSTTEPADSSSGGNEDTTGSTIPEPTRTPRWPAPWPFGADSRLVVWGQSGIPTANLPVFANIYYDLAGVAPGEQPLAIGWIGECDPRVDPEGCSAGDVQPFFDMIDGLGTIEFTPSIVDPSAYDVVIADFCGPVDSQEVAALLEAGEGVLALGDDACITAQGISSARAANPTIAHFGVRFGTQALTDPRVPVPPEAQSGLLEGVASLDAQELLLQRVDESVAIVLGETDQILLSRRSDR